MTLFQGLGVSPSQSTQALGHLISLFGAVGDYALGNPAGFGPRIGSIAAAIAKLGACTPEECDALAFAGVLHGIGALGNSGLRKSDALPPRAAMMERWNIPASGARRCELIPGLPEPTAEIVRWHAESWDGTGYPDQLRWHGIPRTAQFLHIAEMFVDSGEPEDALNKIQESSGRIFSPDEVRTFVMWWHTYGGEVELAELPVAALKPQDRSIRTVLSLLSEAIDSHTGTTGRAARIAALAAETAKLLNASERELQVLELAANLFGIGEMKQAELEWHQFDPLAGLGKELRANNSKAAAEVLKPLPAFAELVPVLEARGEWFDGTGLPKHLRSDAIPLAARVLAICIAYDGLDESHRTQIRSERASPIERIEAAGGTQFDPAVVRAFTQALKAKV